MTDKNDNKIKCDKCGLEYQEKICPGCNMAFRTNQVKQNFCTWECYSADYRAKNPKKKRKMSGLVKPVISEDQKARLAVMKKKAGAK